MPASRLKVVYISPGAGGMYCGSCLSDNMLARALGAVGCDVTLVPLYTPILTDEQSVSIDRVFFGGLSVYLRQKVPLVRFLPTALTCVFDSPWLLRTLTRGAVKTDARELGGLTVSMVRGEHGYQRHEVRQLVDWLKRQPRPDIVNLSNLLIAGCVPLLKRELGVPIVVTLQGDDLFLDGLVPPYREQAMTELRRLARDVDAFVVHSLFYADAMASYFDIPPERLHVVPLGLAMDDFERGPVEGMRTLSLSGRGPGEGRREQQFPHPNPLPRGEGAAARERPPTVGFLARICPAKGLHVLVEAFLKLRRLPGMSEARLSAAGWLGASDRRYFLEQQQRLSEAGLAGAVTYEGAVDRAGKLAFLQQIDVLSVPTVYREPKGRYVLEALAAGVPVVQPRHGAFPELLARLGGGVLVEPENPAALAAALHELLLDGVRRRELGQRGLEGLHQHHTDEHAARATLEVYRRYASGTATSS